MLHYCRSMESPKCLPTLPNVALGWEKQFLNSVSLEAFFRDQFKALLGQLQGRDFSRVSFLLLHLAFPTSRPAAWRLREALTKFLYSGHGRTTASPRYCSFLYYFRFPLSETHSRHAPDSLKQSRTSAQPATKDSQVPLLGLLDISFLSNYSSYRLQQDLELGGCSGGQEIEGVLST